MIKRIAIVCNYKLLEDRVGGMDYFFWCFQKACNDKQIEIDWFFPNLASHGEYHKFNIIPPLTNESLEKSVFSHLIIKKVQYSNVITHFVELCTSFFADLKKIQNSNIIAVDHNPRPINGYSLKKRLKKRLKGILYSKHIDQFIGVSDYTSHAILNDFGRFLENKTQTIYNGVLIDKIIPKVNERRKLNPKFLVVSHLRESKGIQDLIKAVNALPDALKEDLKIDLYGSGPYKEELFKLVRLFKLEPVFSFKGNQSNLNEVYQNYDHLIQPTHMECFSLSILESLAANIPVLTTPVGGNLEIVTHNKNGFIFEAKAINQLVCLLESIINGEKYITDNTRTLIENKFSIDSMVDNYMELIK